MASVKKVKAGGIFNDFKDTEAYLVCQIKDGYKICGVKSTKGTANWKELDPAILKDICRGPTRWRNYC